MDKIVRNSNRIFIKKFIKMNRNKLILPIIWLVSILLVTSGASLAQCSLTNYSLSPNGYMCGSSSTITVTMAGSQVGVSYQLGGAPGNFGSPVAGTGSAISWSNVPLTAGQYQVYGTGNGCTSAVVATTPIYVMPVVTGTIRTSSNVICPGGSVTLTAVVPPASGRNDSYIWFNHNGPPVTPIQTSSTFTTSTAGTYDVQVNSNCGSILIPGPAITIGPTPVAPGPVTGSSLIGSGTAQSVYTVTAAANASSYSWSLSNVAAGTINGAGTTGTLTWNPSFSGSVTINASANFQCASPAATGLGVTVSSPLAGVPPTSNPANDYNLNWVNVRDYDENGTEIGSSKSFFDNMGKSIQTQTKNESAGSVLATQTLYDLQGRATGTTLAAPINNGAFAYNVNFLTNSGGTGYNYTNFDWNSTFSATLPYSKSVNPDAVQNTLIGSVGWYYSNNNTLDPYVATTSYPYSRGDFYHDGTGAEKRSSSVGDQLKMGSGHETSSNGFPVQNELNNYLAIRNKFFQSAVVGNIPTGLVAQALQSVLTDQNGTSVLTITDLSGKRSLMSGRADATASAWLPVTNTLNISNVQPLYSFLVTANIYNFPIAGLTVSSPNTVTITCPSCSTQTVYTGTGNSYSYSGTGNNTYLITSAYPFTVTETVSEAGLQIPTVTWYDQAEATYSEAPTTSVQYFQMAVPGVVNITGPAGSYTLTNMTTDLDITSTFAGTTLPVGYYKVTVPQIPIGSTSTVNNITVTYTNKYSDIGYNYYNQLGQLIASIAPNGVQALIANSSAYPGNGPIPFATTYSYDLQGRLISTTSPDGGTSQFVYRTDGKIRFSQNAYQANQANAGSGNKEKFSYTNYDNIGRPIESGEYVVPGTTAVFSGLGTNTALLDATDATENVSGCTKQSQINTVYDLPATNLSLTGYVQDPGFLKGAISYTYNANSTTWYNYDDHDRLTWMVKNLVGITGYKTVDYTYNDQGNVTTVDYQKNTPAERFTHYYNYDADGRLVNVQTSRDGGSTKLQQGAYYYYLHGPLKRVELGVQLQGIDYIYTPQGWLKAINTPTQIYSNDPGKDGVSNSFANDAFGMQLEYFAGDYIRSGSNVTSIPTGQTSYFNGNVNGLSWQSNKPPSVVAGDPTGTIQQATMYTYNYDKKYQFTTATWGTPAFTATPSFTGGGTFSEKGITYDFNGNITALQRTNSAGTLSDNFSQYSYFAGTNKLSGVGTAAAPTNYAAYTYDELGRLKSETQTGAGAPAYYLQYDVTGKVTAVYSDAALTQLKESFSYDEDGNRVKTINGNGTTYYIYDASGNVLAIYNGTTATPPMIEAPVYGGDRLGTYFVAANNYQYELRDNVGSVRVVINRTKNVSGQADIVQYNDYFPYGNIARNGGPGYRYEYQGAYAEKDPAVAGANDFELRLYDSRIARWLGIDPIGQYNSPYEGMGNNPINSYDPNGACDPCATPPAGAPQNPTDGATYNDGTNNYVYSVPKDGGAGSWSIGLNTVVVKPPVYDETQSITTELLNHTINSEFASITTIITVTATRGNDGTYATLNTDFQVKDGHLIYNGADLTAGDGGVGFDADGMYLFEKDKNGKHAIGIDGDGKWTSSVTRDVGKKTTVTITTKYQIHYDNYARAVVLEASYQLRHAGLSFNQWMWRTFGYSNYGTPVSPGGQLGPAGNFGPAGTVGPGGL